MDSQEKWMIIWREDKSKSAQGAIARVALLKKQKKTEFSII